MILADRIAEFLAAQGCTHAFGFIGGANLTVLHAIAKRMTLITCHHEQACALAATYYYRVCGRMAPVVVTAGGGSANVLTGVVEANMDGVPLLVIAGNEMSKFLALPATPTIGFQGFNIVAVATPITKAALRADNPLGAVLAVEGLYKTALSHRQGPVLLDLPQDIAAMEMKDEEVKDFERPWKNFARDADYEMGR